MKIPTLNKVQYIISTEVNILPNVRMWHPGRITRVSGEKYCQRFALTTFLIFFTYSIMNYNYSLEIFIGEELWSQSQL